MTSASPHPKTTRERVIFSLPQALVADVERYAERWRGGNKSGFVADAIRSYIDYRHKVEHTARLRQSYASAAAETRASVAGWEALAEETWTQLDAREEGKNRPQQ